MRASRAITGRTDLDLLTGRRIKDGFAALDPAGIEAVEQLAALTPPSGTPGNFLQLAQDHGLGQAAYTLAAVWYVGTVGAGQQARTVSYAEALMYRPVADGLSPPTYCLGGPGWWTAPVPEAGVARPTTPAPGPPPTVGFPVPTQRVS